MTHCPVHDLLPYAVPATDDARLILYGIRRMAAGGIGDAHAANAFFVSFGLHYRRPLVLMRALVVEIARTSTTRLTIAPCCCPRMSASEQAMLEAVSCAPARPDTAEAVLRRLMRVSRCDAVLATTAALATCLIDLGRPLHEHPVDCV